jgi:hypothetical protein
MLLLLLPFQHAAEDIIYLIPEQLSGSSSSSSSSSSPAAVAVTASLRCTALPAPRIHQHLHGSALAAARGRLYMLGGSHFGWSGPAVTPSQLEVFDPHVGGWFSTGAALPGRGQLSGEVAV